MRKVFCLTVNQINKIWVDYQKKEVVMKKVKIVYVISQLSYGGAETSLLDICNYIDSNTFDITVISVLKSDTLQNLFKKNKKIKVISLNFKSRYNIFIILMLGLRLFCLKPDIIHTHLPVANIYTRFFSLFIKSNYICTRHTVIFKNNLFYKIDLWTSKINKYMIANSLFTKEYLLKYKYIEEDKIEIVNLGVDFTKFKKSNIEKKDFLYKYSIDSDAKIIVNIGSFKKEKGHLYLLKAFKKVVSQNPKCYLFLAGKGLLFEEIRALACSLGIEENVIFTGNLSNIGDILSFADVFVSPSISESFGISLIEAMYFKVPVIAFNVDAVPNLIKDNETGFLVELYDYKSLFKKILEVLNNNNSNITDKAFRLVTEYYCIKKTSKDLADFYLNKVLK